VPGEIRGKKKIDGDEKAEAAVEHPVGVGGAGFSYLRVIASGSKSCQPRYVIEGSLRQAGPTMRLTAQLVDAATGGHLWAETYNRPFQPESVFTLLDDLAPRIVSTVHGQLGESESAHNAACEIRALKPDYASVARQEFLKVLDAELVEHLMDGLRKAGLEIAGEKSSAPGPATRTGL
jgi:hypothetical protein